MTFVLSALAFLVLLTLLVIVHELGHFSMARLFGVHVEEFGFGLAPRLKKLFSWRGTLFSLNVIPFGGFVRLQGETSVDPRERGSEGSFAAASIPARLIILFAGVCMNLLLAITLLTVGFWLWKWVPTYLTLSDLQAGAGRGEVTVEWSLFVSKVIPGMPAARAKVATGGILTAVNGTAVTTVEEVLALQAKGKSVAYTLRYPTIPGGKEFTEEKIVRVEVWQGKTGIALSAFAQTITGTGHSLLGAVCLAWREAWMVIWQTIRGAGKLVSSIFLEGRVPKGITGIVGIAKLTDDSVREGLMTYLRLVALLSLSLAALNVLPFPALDGGRMLFVLIEMVTGGPVHRRIEIFANTLGFLLILLLIVAVTLNDILHLFASSLP